jgi:single-strand DNA-binding protein
VTFVDVDAFGRQAETIAQYLKKGNGILVEGRLRLDQWDDKQTGQKRSKLGVVVEGFQFVGGSRGDTTGVPGQASRPPAAAAPSSATPSAPAEEMPAEDDVPF